MSTQTVERKPGQFADERFRARNRAWPVVAPWSSFDEEPVLSGNVAWIRGGDLNATLAKLPVRLSPEDVAALVRALRGTTTLRNHGLVEGSESLPADVAFAAAA